MVPFWYDTAPGGMSLLAMVSVSTARAKLRMAPVVHLTTFIDSQTSG
jgi:hypothetical protein